MAKAIREFVAGMDFPPSNKSDSNFKLAGLVLAMLQFCNGLSSGTATATCSPAASQVAGLLHCSERTFKRRLKDLRGLGLLTQKGRGHDSPLFTFHQTRQAGHQLTPRETGHQMAPLSEVRGDTSGIQRGQDDASEGTPRHSEGTTVAPLWCKASGSSLEKNTLECEPDEFVSDLNQVTLPEGLVFRNGKIIQTGGAR